MTRQQRRRGRPRVQPPHRFTPVWVQRIDPDRHAKILLRIAMHHAEQQKQQLTKGGDDTDDNKHEND